MLTIGVEEEYLLLAPVTGVPAARAGKVHALADAQAALTEGEVQRELMQAQLEVATPVCESLDEVGGHLLRMRHALAEAAEASGCRLAATGSAPFTDRLTVPITTKPRYRKLRRSAPGVADELLINGMHVHVGVPDREAGVRVLNALRPWLPVLTGLGANSPMWRGRDSGFASWRTLVFQGLPVIGLPPEFDGAKDYDQRIQDLVDTGFIGDRGQLYWHARLSERFPTVEVRAMDVQLQVDEAVLLTGLIRALAARTLDGGEPLRGYPPEYLRAASWHAARNGASGLLHDPRTGRLAPSREVAAGLLTHVDAELRANGERDRLATLLDRLHHHGNGAMRQRRTLRRHGRTALVRMIADQTVGT
ncbi:glutamate--cysteine ligase [Kitasatospora paracochleata]|uniref:Putative glutamate--cysteine ligase 2 n=1 Tax=Kitasatospora paracochleata TaxID=58354 RepID=A0ABT1J2N1_9ACTN|nr:glutamate--cysteine ligase [Kitasatospora paracochleata]MCP2311628.1 carboxylate-amine ligase [Kitasatospora paracochleata]